MYRDIGGYKTPDGAIYNKLSIKLAIEGIGYGLWVSYSV